MKVYTELPLFDSVPIEKHIVPVLHLLIGVGNNLLESLLEWIYEQIEKLTHHEVVHRNAVIHAGAQYHFFSKRL